jgi:hypothetical protein
MPFIVPGPTGARGPSGGSVRFTARALRAVPKREGQRGRRGGESQDSRILSDAILWGEGERRGERGCERFFIDAAKVNALLDSSRSRSRKRGGIPSAARAMDLPGLG